MRHTRSLQSDEIRAILHSIRKEPPAPVLRKVAAQAKWREVQLDSPSEIGALRTLWHKVLFEPALSDDTAAPTVSEVAAQYQNHTLGRPGLQAKVTRYLNRAGPKDVDTGLVLQESSSGIFIVDGTTRAIALYVRYLRGDDVSGFLPMKATLFSLR